MMQKTKGMTFNQFQRKYLPKTWWLKKHCPKCVFYPNCDFIERNSPKPRGCSLYQEADLMKLNRQELP